jgi:hypothetical protein
MMKEVRPIRHALHKTHAVLTTISGILLTEKDSPSIGTRIYKTQTRGHHMMIGKAMIIKVIVTSGIAGSGNQYHLCPTKVNGHVRQVSIDYNNKKIFYIQKFSTSSASYSIVLLVFFAMLRLFSE